MTDLNELLDVKPMDNATKKLAEEVDNKIETARSFDFAYTDDKGKIHVDNIRFSKYFLKKYKLLYVDNGKDGSLMFYNEKSGYWDIITNKKLANLISNELDIAWTFTARRDVLTKVSDSIDHINYYDFINSNKALVFNFINGVFNWETMQLEQHDSRYNFTSVGGIELNTSYNSNNELLTDCWIKETFGDDTLTIKQYIGYMFYPSYEPIQAFVILSGSGNNGKSAFFRYLTDIIGLKNVSFVPLQALTGEDSTRFKISELIGKYANMHPDISGQYIAKSDVLKSLTGGDWVNADVKGKVDIKFNNFSKMLFAANKLPAVRDDTKGFFRRTNILQFNEIPDFKKKYDWDKILNERPVFIWECIKLAKDAINQHKLFKSNRNQERTKDWLYSNNPIKEFLADCTIKTEGAKTLRDNIYNAYCNWCILNGYKPTTSRKFYKALRDDEGITEIDKKEPYKTRKYYFIGIAITGGIDEKHPADRFK